MVVFTIHQISIHFVAIEQEVADAISKWNHLFTKGDFDRLMDECYTEDGFLNAPGTPSVCGKKGQIFFSEQSNQIELNCI